MGKGGQGMGFWLKFLSDYVGGRHHLPKEANSLWKIQKWLSETKMNKSPTRVHERKKSVD